MFQREYICNGTIDCPNDKSDEESCVCSDSTQSKTCKIINIKQMRSPTYYMIQNGQCLKYIKHDKIYKQFNIDDDIPKHETQTTSQLATFDTLSEQKENSQKKLLALEFKQYFRCLNLSEVPCWEGYFKCYNITSLCIFQLNVNNTLIPCENGEYLQHSKTFLFDTMFKCLDSYCIPYSYVCDGKLDCPQGNDEFDKLVCK